MRYVLGALAFLVPLAFLPNWSFYYDVTPKVVILLLGVACVGCWSGIRPLIVETSQSRRWNGWLAGGCAVSVLLSSVAAGGGVDVWIGSDWRRLGAVALLSMLGVAWTAAQVDRGPWIRGLCGAGLVAGAYGIAQYFGWDPWLDASGYHFGDGAYQIVRPPGPMGHSNYLAAFLLWPAFLGIGQWRAERSWLGISSAAVSVVAIALCGSRGAWAGLAAGGLLWMWQTRPGWKLFGVAAAAIAIAAAGFYASPAGERLRARMFWIGEDAAGGSRLLLWRDSLGMASAKPLLGFGPDQFASAFPQHQSVELSQAFPDFYHESPHNLFLDALVNQGAVGLLLLLAWSGLGVWSVRRSRDGIAGAMASGLVATVVAHQFAALVVPTAFALFGMLGVIAGLEPVETRNTVPRWMGAIPMVAGLACAVVGWQLARSDGRLAEIRNALDRHQPAFAANAWMSSSGPIRADLYFAQRWTRESADGSTAIQKLKFSQLAANAAVAATKHTEQQQNSWYTLAMLQATANDAAAVERSLRAASAAAPTWFKPHWTLAKLFWTTGHPAEAQAEARIALDLNGGRNAEVAESLEEIVRSGSASQ